MSKLLMAVELGTDVYRGKSLDEIDLDLEMAIPSKEGAQQAAQHGESDVQVSGPSKAKRSNTTATAELMEDSEEEANLLTSTKRRSQEPKRAETAGVKGCRRPWTSKEKAAVRRQLGRFITLQRVPGKEPCVTALEAEPVLCSRSWKDVKNQVYNSITAQKRKLL
ncbi:hypothetical protein KUCAC02_002449 [Chaenocephalus aceratus]|uniref:Uncharacterized protein n=1 Tax=Chaenocephalus aceratus TaxID=36190 RepID=A0ACB9XTQ7_CHAAC|nr:hypothetical protein KUCAC02_002449 [Chaenocephalus aceratus]